MLKPLQTGRNGKLEAHTNRVDNTNRVREIPHELLLLNTADPRRRTLDIGGR